MKLFKVLPPPEYPVENYDEEFWENPEKFKNFSFPRDYIDFISIYGTGCIANFIWIYNPVSKNKNLNLTIQYEIQRDCAVQFLELTEGDFPGSQYFQSGNSLVPFGVSNNGDMLFWRSEMEEDEESYLIIVFSSRFDQCEAYTMSFSDFLLGLLEGCIKSSILKDNLNQDYFLFSPLDMNNLES